MKQPVGVILAGGQGRRMGGADKALLMLGGQALLQHAADRLAPQVAELAVNANGDPARLPCAGLTVLPDAVAGQPGPLAGILAALDWAAATGAASVVTVPVDTPFLPPDLVPRLLLAGGGGPAIACTGGARARDHPVVGLWPTDLRAGLRDRLAAGQRRVVDWADAVGAARAPFPDSRAFFNVNRPEDIEAAEVMIRAGASGG